MLQLIDDDEWFELGLALNDAIRRLPTGSRLIESLQMPPFRLAMSASSLQNDTVVTRPWKAGLATPADAANVAATIASSETLAPGALSIALTQTADGEHYAICVVGLPSEQCSWTTFEIPRGGHVIDIGEKILRLLEGWALRPADAGSGDSGAFAA